MKYIDADKLNAEIDRLYNGEAPKHDRQCNFVDGYFTGIDTISQLIDSLQQEQHEVNLEKEIDRWFSEKYMQNMEGLPIKPIVQIIAHYFFELGLNTQKGK